MHTRAHSLRRILIGAVAALAAVSAGVGAASAEARVDRFDGACSLQGTVHFSPPATNSQQSLDVTYDAGGACTGTLDGRPIANAAVRAHNAAQNVDGSCVHADTTTPGTGSIEFADGTVIRFSSEFHFVATHG